MTKNQLETIVKLYAGQLSEPVELVDADARTLDQLVYELKAMAELEAEPGASPVIIVKSSQRLPWILSIVLALLVGFLAAKLLMPTSIESAVDLTVEEEFGIKYLSADRLHLEFTKGDIYSLSNQILPRLQDAGIITDDILQLYFTGADSEVTLGQRDLEALPSLRELAFKSCELDWDGFVHDEIVFISFESCPGLKEVDLRLAKQLRVFRASNCDDLESLKMPPQQNRLCKLVLDNCQKLGTIAGLERVDEVKILELNGIPAEIPTSFWQHCKNLRVAYFTLDLNDFGELFKHATLLERLSLSDCREVTSLNGITNLNALEHLNVAGCSIQRWPALSNPQTYVYVYQQFGEHDAVPLPEHRIRDGRDFWLREAEIWDKASQTGFCTWE